MMLFREVKSYLYSSQQKYSMEADPFIYIWRNSWFYEGVILCVWQSYYMINLSINIMFKLFKYLKIVLKNGNSTCMKSLGVHTNLFYVQSNKLQDRPTHFCFFNDVKGFVV